MRCPCRWRRKSPRAKRALRSNRKYWFPLSRRLRTLADAVVVEGVGGWSAPLSATLDQADLVRLLRLPVVMVVGMRLGCLNHARLTARAIAADGCELVGWIANHVDPDMQRQDENFEMLCQRLPVPCWGRLPHDPAQEAAHLSRFLNPTTL